MIDLSNIELLILALGALGLGMYLLLKGGNWTIDGGVYVAKTFGISPLVIGFTIIAFGTSLPELIVSVNANLAGSPGIAIGNVLGSNIANILLVIGITALFGTLVAVPGKIMRDLCMMLFATAILTGLMLHGDISRVAGSAMILLLVAYVLWQYFMASKGKIEVDVLDEVEEPAFKSLPVAVLFLFLGLGSIALGAEFLVRGAKVSATIIGVPEAVIGLSVIAIGTSLPELSTCIIAVMKKHSDIVIGNILGSNVFNILMIIGATALIKPIGQASIAPQVVTLDIWVVLGVTLLFSIILMTYKRITWPIGLVFTIGYLGYIGLIYGLYLTKGIIN